MVPIEHYLTLGALLFSIGLGLVLTRKNAILALVGIELIFNSANINLIAFNYFDPEQFQGMVFALFVILIAVAEVSVALAILFNIVKHYSSIDLDKLTKLRG
jgi:NADH-quinone oxidoreductase subunit K